MLPEILIKSKGFFDVCRETTFERAARVGTISWRGMSTGGTGRRLYMPQSRAPRAETQSQGLWTLLGCLPPCCDNNERRAGAHSRNVIPASQTRRRAVRAQRHWISTLRTGRPQTLDLKAWGLAARCRARGLRGSDHRRSLAPRCRHRALACKEL